jgi:hypothetical protein
MSAEVILYLLAGWQPLPCCTPPNFPYPQLPSEVICELCYHQCEVDRQWVCLQLEFVGGWQRRQLLEVKCETDRLAATWYAAWWVTWSRATPEQQQEWVEILVGYTGPDAFWRGDVPLPLSVR